MKLLDRTLVGLLSASVLAIGCSTAVQYYLTKSEVEARVDRKLQKEKRLIKEQLRDIQPTIGFSFNTERSSVRFLTNSDVNCPDSLYNGVKIDDDGEEISFRILSTCIELEGQLFRVEIKKENEETAAFVRSIFLTHFIILIVVVIVFVLFKFFFLKNTWGPFFTTLEQIKTQDFQNEKVAFDTNSRIREFNELNTELQELANKIYTEYQSQKDFVENASHELLTPIAVIRNKMELLVQSESLRENELELISSMLSTLDRLARINRSLILLSKIDHHHFEEVEKVEVDQLASETLNFFEDQIRLKELAVRKDILDKLTIKMHPDLAHILMSNIVKNAVNHNVQGGILTVELNADKLVVKNTGALLEGSPDQLFERFTTAGNNPESIGLGLSIIQKICKYYSIELSYLNEGNLHIISLRFPKDGIA